MVNRKLILAALLVTVPATISAQGKAPAEAPGQASAQQQAPMLDSNLRKFSYAMGYRTARDLMKQGILELDPQALAVGVSEAMGGESFRFEPAEIRKVMTEYQKELVERRAKQALVNEDAGKAFMLSNAQKDGVKKLEGGVQYIVLASGDGEKPGATDTIKVHYVGTLLSGTEFDSSRRRGDPAQFSLNQVIPGWQQALAQMPVGSHWKVWIPPNLAYGLEGSGGKIGPSETLVFDIELLKIVAKGPSAAADKAEAMPEVKPEAAAKPAK
jgi:FKBP-type peptidyl-prolyl cis-trans isomerase FklB